MRLPGRMQPAAACSKCNVRSMNIHLPDATEQFPATRGEPHNMQSTKHQITPQQAPVKSHNLFRQLATQPLR